MYYGKYIKKYLPYFIMTPICMTVEVLGDVFMPKCISWMVDKGVANHDIGYILSIGGLMIVCIIFMILGGVGGQWFATHASVSFATDLRLDVYKKIQSFSFKNIDKFSTGSLVTRLTNDITQMQNVLRMVLIMALRSPGMLIGAFIMACTLNVKLAVIIGVIIPFLGTSIVFIIKTAFPRFEVLQKKLDALNSRIQENITNIRVIKSFVCEEREEERFVTSNHDLRDSSINAFKIVILNMPVMTLAMNVATIAVVWFGGNFVIAGNMKIGNLTAFTTYITQILMSLMMISNIFLQTSRASASSKRIKEVLQTEADLVDDDAAEKDKTVEKGDISFENVCFKYREDNKEYILKDINLEIKSGETVGIIGSTGSGKTSLVQLIPRLYDATEGVVKVDGVDVRDYSLKHLRTGVGMVLQKNVLFSGTVAQNLHWGDENASPEELRAAAAAAQADGFISEFDGGYDSYIDQGGANVSGGQKQRLCIARALLKKPKILILDDSTSAVDTATEAKIRHTFKTTLRDATKIIIAQRISSIEDADKIIVLKDGMISAVGTHSELIRSNEEYKEIYYSQKEKEDDKNAS